MSQSPLLFFRTFLLIVLFQLVACTGSYPKWIEVSPDFIPYVSAYSGGIISSTSTIRVRLAQEIRGIVAFGEPVEEEYFDFEPSISGKTRWVDASTIEFIPEKRLPQNKQYTAHFNLGKLYKVPEKLEDMAFSFKTIQQSAEISLGFPNTYNPDDLSRQFVEGSILTADKADLETVKKTLQARQNSGELTINWSQSADQRKHYFKIEQIKRPLQTADVLQVQYDGAAFDSDETNEWTRDLVPQGKFQVVNATVVNDDEPRIELIFSDPLLEIQDLTGLIQVAGTDLPDAVINGHVLSIYQADATEGTTNLIVSPGILNALGKRLEVGGNYAVTFEDAKPDIRFPGGGVILPGEDGMIVPFEAVSLKKADVQITQIFENNIPQFLQTNNMNGDGGLKQVGKIIAIKTIPLETAHISSRKKYSAFALNLNELIKTEPGAIYRIELRFRKEYATYVCQDGNESDDMQTVSAANDFKSLNKPGYYGGEYEQEYYGDEGYEEDYDWKERNNPCSSTYYLNHQAATRNVLASNIGLIAKNAGDGSWQFIASDIVSAQPLSGVALRVIDFQHQQIASIKTDSKGFAYLKSSPDDAPFLLIASQGKQKGYLKLNDGEALSTSQFDVSGEEINEGIKGFLYAERGVWRPGDTLFVQFMLETPKDALSGAHPIVFEMTNSRGQGVKKEVQVYDPSQVIYSFPVATGYDSPTGNYTASVTIGSSVFRKNFKVETIMPNRLKIDFNFPDPTALRASQASSNVPLRVSWLHGAPATSLRANVAVTLSPSSTSFPAFKDYTFDDPSRTISTEEVSVFDGLLDASGEATVNPMIRSTQQAPGQLKADFTVRVFEPGGGFSIDRFSTPYLPYTSFAGVQAPKGEGWGNILTVNKQHTLNLACVNDLGKGIPGRTLSVNFYKTSYEWWWQRNGNINDYYNAEYAVAVKTAKVVTNAAGKAVYQFSFNEDELATYLIRVCDETSGHCTGTTIYVDDDSWMSRNTGKTQHARDLSLQSDKEKYTTGESINISFPSPSHARALVSIEDGSHILESRWIETEAGKTEFTIKALPEYAPNVYVHLTVLQPYKHANELPVRMYGLLPVFVEDPDTRLQPVISAPDVVRPETKLSVGIKEKSGKEMEYTLALVDDGLLDLTRFKTPDPWSSFYAREALGVVSWDLYDDVIDAYSGAFESVVTIGGDAELDGKKKSTKANRFKPMVRFIGPFKLKKGGSANHSISIPAYFGSARIMVVAGNPQQAYGSAEKRISIRKPLMALATLPRVVSPGETVRMPISIFALEKSVQQISISCTPNPLFTLTSPSRQTISMKSPGERLVEFEFKVANTTGLAKVKVVVSSGKETAIVETELDVRTPNLPQTDVTEVILKPGQVWQNTLEVKGMAGTREASVELSGMPAINLSKRLKELTEYPHGCVEQTTSAAFPQLFLQNLVDLSEVDKKRISNHVKAAIKRLALFQTSTGGMAYWPGGSQADDWSTCYAGHFLIEAQTAGYPVSSSMMKKWKNYQKATSRLWKSTYTQAGFDQIQAYRLYTLALAGSPEIGAMNRMREVKSISPQARWHLASAYQLAGQKETARQLLKGLSQNFSSSYYTTFGSVHRDEALALLTLSEMGMVSESYRLARTVAENLGRNEWMSTQTTAWSLLALSKNNPAPKSGKRILAELTIGKKSQKISGNKPLVEVPLQLDASGKSALMIKNTNQVPLYARIIRRSTFGSDQLVSANQNQLQLQVSFTDMTGKDLDPSAIPQGTDFTAHLTIRNTSSTNGFNNLALSMLFASGWEINNTRVNDVANVQEGSSYEYQDIRDDRVLTYFQLLPGTSKTYSFKFNAAYVGRFYLPAILCEAMYDSTVFARSASRWVQVVRPQPKAI